MNKKGFTLIEIIIVIVIIAVLATLALPRITGQLATSEAAEAMNLFGAIKRAAIDCYDMSATGTFSACSTGTQLGIGVTQGAKFTYRSTWTAAGDLYVQAGSVRSNFADYITMSVQTNGLTRFQTPLNSPFAGVVQRTGQSMANATPVIAAAFTF